MELILARHAQTPANEQRQFCGKIDPPLSPEGEAEARRSAQVLGGHFDLVITSGMKRTQQTGSILAPDARTEDWPCLREMDFGDFEGLTAKNIESALPQEWARYIADPLKYTFPNGGNAGQYILRAEEDVRRIACVSVKRMLVVSHKGWIAAALSTLLHGDAAHMFHYDIRPAGFAKLSVTDGYAVLKQLY